MAKQKLKLALAGAIVKAPVWQKEEVFWEGSKIGCPYCAVIKRAKALIDIVQYGLIEHDLCITIMQCRACDKMFGVRYTIPHDEAQDALMLDESETI